MAKGTVRLDRLLVDRGLCETRTRAQALILEGRVIVGEARVDKPGTAVAIDAPIRLREPEHRFVSRGGIKLRAALDAFEREGALVVEERIAMDVGASTGGFTDCLLQAGVARVHAVDVGYGQLSWKLVNDPRVVVHDRTNVRGLAPETIGESVDLVTVDCSFIALSTVIPVLPKFLAASADLVLLIKPQFELGPGRVGKGGIVRDPEAHGEALEHVRSAALAAGLVPRGEIASPITGRDGNREFLAWYSWGAGG